MYSTFLTLRDTLMYNLVGTLINVDEQISVHYIILIPSVFEK